MAIETAVENGTRIAFLDVLRDDYYGVARLSPSPRAILYGPRNLRGIFGSPGRVRERAEERLFILPGVVREDSTNTSEST